MKGIIGRWIPAINIVFSLMLALVFTLSMATKAVAQNSPPVVNAGPDQEILTGAWTVLQGSATDPDGDAVVRWLWEVDSAPAYSLPFISDPGTPDPSFTGDRAGDYVLSLKATDGDLWSVPDFVTIHARDLMLPKAVISADVTCGGAPLTVQFDGSLSTVDPTGEPLEYDWSFGDGGVSSEKSPSYIFRSMGTYTVILTVFDQLGQADVDTFQIKVGCLGVSPVSHDFGDVSLGSSKSMFFTVTNVCESWPYNITVSNIMVENAGNPVFNIIQPPELPVTLASGETVEVEVAFAPDATGLHEANLVIESDWYNTPLITASLRGMGVSTELPPGVRGVNVQLSGEVVSSEFDSIPVGSSVTGYYSYDADLPDIESAEYMGEYHPVTFYLEFVGGSSVYSTEATIEVINNAPNTGIDIYYVKFPWVIPIDSPGTLTGAFSTDVEVLVVGHIVRGDLTGAVFDDTALPDPTSLLDAMPFDYCFLTFQDDYGSPSAVTKRVFFNLTSFYVTHFCNAPEAKVEALAEFVRALNNKQGITNSLDAKLEVALRALSDLNENNDAAAIKSLEAFIRAVEAQRGEELTYEQANELIAQANATIDCLSW